MCTCSSNIIMNSLPAIKVLLKITNLSPVVWGCVLFMSIRMSMLLLHIQVKLMQLRAQLAHDSETIATCPFTSCLLYNISKQIVREDPGNKIIIYFTFKLFTGELHAPNFCFFHFTHPSLLILTHPFLLIFSSSSSFTDFKGYTLLRCSEKCMIGYHPLCWRKYKSSLPECTSEKGFLSSPCITPDCPGIINYIAIFEMGRKPKVCFWCDPHVHVHVCMTWYRHCC